MNGNSEIQGLTRKEREFLSRRQEILAAATRIFAQKGYHGAAMSEIAREAEFSTGSLYNFFKNKEELYFTLLKDKIEIIEREMDEIYSLELGIEDRLGRFVERVLSFVERERDFFRIFVEQRTTFENSAKGELADIIHDKYEGYLGRMVQLMAAGVREGFFKELRPEELALSFIGIMNGFILIFVNQDDATEFSSKAPLILDLFFNGARRSP